MAKRPLGLGKKQAQKKKQKFLKENTPEVKSTSESPTPTSETKTPSNQIQIELQDSEDADNEIVQLNGLWKTYFESDKDDEMLLNGIIHECDRILRLINNNNNNDKSEEATKLKALVNKDDRYYAIFALALSELTIFKKGSDDDDEMDNEVKQFFDLALQRCQDGLDCIPNSQLLKLVMSKILLQRLPLEYISKLNVKSKESKGKYLKLYEQFGKAKENFSIYKNDLPLTLEVLNSTDDLLDIIENFGHEDDIEEGLDSDDDEELEPITLAKDHPLYKFQKNHESDLSWLKEQLIALFDIMHGSDKLIHPVARKIGELYMKFADSPRSQYLKLQYGDDEDEQNSIAAKDKGGLVYAAQREAIELVDNSLKYLRKAQVKDDPETWVQLAEACIEFGNLCDNESIEQKKAYQEAEEILKKANRATNGKYQDILDNLLD
ncbi:Ett1p NDAI_0F00590 [Naumovozyma dairenensis CBS 421]|uniref:Enhancer of translation termination 1 n=1 Tax=Naumovozyma dairenensis (strain ATCC 10597 / BCRC 20456 / CBS 421 / NBRC 0211 / NRRL Y-12639) TaxID=1071378 RepID=G0WC67_NAUDC|nr:hypothetical protein NDAI_0F00590 [Naumovozyma dairenensis CBS 421]CCD25378.1 hypothetical protein NDAI_0F00590 [Naumovozyma dairenensis CBS 421]